MARYSEAQNKAAQRYIKKTYDAIMIRVPKGNREKYKKDAERAGKSFSKYVFDMLEAGHDSYEEK